MATNNKNSFLSHTNLQLRPNAAPGLWLMFLLPISLIISAAKHSVISTYTYKHSSIFSFGLLCTSVLFIYNGGKNKMLKPLSKKILVITLMTSILFHICLHTGIIFSLWSGLFATLIYYKLYLFFLEKLSRCFTYGEAGVCCQGFTLLLYFTINNFINSLLITPHGTMQIATCIIQQGLLAVTSIIFLAYKLKINNPVKFYIMGITIFAFYIFILLYIMIDKNPLLWIFDQILQDLFQKKIVGFWALCSVGAVVVINKQVSLAQKASTIRRKFFHILAVAVFIPGLLYNCSFLYLASGVVLGIFLILELLRILEMPPLSQSLQNGMIVFGDDKDAGIVALTPIYLLVGCSLPLWIHPAPCDITNSAGFNLLPLLSGILIIGIGDTSASIVGSKFGKHFWEGCRKTKEGTIACILSQFLVVVLLIYFDFLKINQMDQYLKTAAAILTTSFIEAKTEQVDNLALPLISYIILI